MTSDTNKIEIYDTTLRDGSQLEGISLTVEDKLRIAEQLDWLGVHYIEAGWPGANPKDDELFRRTPSELQLSTSTLVAFGSTRRVKGKVDSDDTLRHLVEANVGTVCIVGKSWDYHVTEALGTTLDEGVAMVGDSVEFLRRAGMQVLFDAEHFFDGFKRNPEFSLRVLEAAATNGASHLVLCDTNGGTLPHDVERVVREVVEYFHGDLVVGVHLHDDAGTGVANALAGVRGGATQVQGTINGYGERTGNCNLTTIIPNLTLKMGFETIPADRLERLTPVAHHVAELVNMPLNPQAAYVGHSAFAHKAGLHTSAIAKRPDAYEHVDPEVVGNGTRFVVSELAGKSTLGLKAKELGPRARRTAARRRRRDVEAPRARGLPLRGRRRLARAADAARDRMGTGLVPCRVVPGHHRRQEGDESEASGGERSAESTHWARRRHAHRQDRRDRDDRSDGQGARRRRAQDRDRGGQRPGERARPGAANRARRQLPRARARAPHRLQGARARHQQGHRRGDAC